MRAQQPVEVTETRADVARRRLAQLNASFLGTADPPIAPDGSVDALGDEPPTVDPAEPDDLAGPDESPAETGRGHRAELARRLPRLQPVHLRVVATVAVAAGVLLTWWVLAERPQVDDVAEPVEIAAPAASEQADETAEQEEVVVDVAGKVEDPGIVVLPAGARVHEAIEKAGGIKGRVDTTVLNLARVLNDGEQVLVGVEPAGPPAGSAQGGEGNGAAPLNLNTATQEELLALPGVGPVTAEAIVGWRTDHGSFSSVDDLLEVSGIGEKTLAELRDRVTV